MNETQREPQILAELRALADETLPRVMETLLCDADEEKRRQTEVRICILKQVRICCADLRYGQANGHVALSAWAARNLLELWIWSLYVTQSNANLERFQRDVMLDVVDTVTALSLPTHEKADRTAQQHERFVAEMQKHKLAMGYAPKERYLHIAGVADEVGLGKVYSKYYRMFSKAAHQTAMLVLEGAEKHPMGAGAPTAFASIAVWQIINTVAAGYEAAERFLFPIDFSALPL